VLPVGRVDVVLEQHGYALERAARAVPAPVPVARGGLAQGVRIGLDHRVQLPVDQPDAGQVERGQPG
jgi:hypothetical protein